MLCPTCYHDVSPREGRCPLCGETAATGPEKVPTVLTVEEGELTGAEGCPWEERGERGSFAAFGETLQSSLFGPSAFFGSLPPGGRAGSALLYAVIVGTISAAVAMAWQKALSGRLSLGGPEFEVPYLSGPVWYLGLAALPLVIVLSAVFRSLVLHLSLTLLGGATERYAATLKTVCYAASSSAFSVFPFIGTPLAWIWRVALIVIGLREVHRISTGKAFMAWLLPFVVLSLFVGAMILGVALLAVKFFPEVGDLIAV